MTNAFDETAARAWLEGPDPDAEGYTMAESLGVDGEDFDFESDNWAFTIEDLAGKAVDAKLLPVGTLVWLTCSSEGLDGALVTRTYDKPSVKLCSSFLDFSDLIDDRKTTGIDCAVSVLSAVHLLASELQLPGKSNAEVDPLVFADTDSLCAVIEVDVFHDGDEPLTVRQWAERGWAAIRDLKAPVIALRNRMGVQIEVDLEDDTEGAILAAAEALANLQHSPPTEQDFKAAEAEVRASIDETGTHPLLDQLDNVKED